jgi:hypothetical protein
MTAPRPGATATSSLFDDYLEELLQGRLLKVIVTGSRDWTDYRLICLNLNRWTIGELHEGGARGADSCARRWAIAHKVPAFRHPADWKKFGRSAGPRRNVDMHDSVKPDLVVAFKDNFGLNPNGGTEHMVSLAWDSGTPVWHVSEDHAGWLHAA